MPNILVAQVASLLVKVISFHSILTTNRGIDLRSQDFIVKVFEDESTEPSFTFAVIVAVPNQLEAGVSVRVVPEILGTTFEVDEVAE